MEIWLQQQASAVLMALRHAQELYGAAPAAHPDLAADRTDEVV